MSATIQVTRLRVSELLRQIWPKQGAKHAAAAAGGSVRTAQAWLTGVCSPSSETLLRMAANNEALRRELIHALGGALPDEGMGQMAADEEGLGHMVAANDGPGHDGPGRVRRAAKPAALQHRA